MHKLLIVSFIFFSGALVSLHAKNVRGTTTYINTLKKVTDVMVNDVTSPVAAGRYYAYVTLSSYEVLSAMDYKKYPSISSHLGFPLQISISSNLIEGADQEVACIFAILKSAQKLLPSGATLSKDVEMMMDHYIKSGMSIEKVTLSSELADQIVTKLVAWAKADGFGRLNNLPRYTPKNKKGYWQPTAPAFMAPIEPNWKTIRPFLLDSAAQYKPLPPAPYDTTKTSSFYMQMMETANVVNKKDREEQEIASFWDCNPFAIEQIGHIEFGLKKISPGGHWIGITGIACQKKKISLKATILTHALLSIVMHDAFIACWDEKYRSDRVRPETAINQLVDPRWRPLLQTPPFPEYVSGHSVVSTAASMILKNIFGKKFKYTDDSEVEFGLPKRKYDSFQMAADEACISRLYGGIHFRDAIEQGIWQGQQVGDLGLNKLSSFFNMLKNKKM